MSSLSVRGLGGRRWFVTTLSRAAVATLTITSVAVALVSVLLTEHRGPDWPAVVVAFLALVATVVPDGRAALATLVAYGTWWLVAVQDATTAWALPAAFGLLTFHTAVAHAASGPVRITADRATLRTWCRDGLLVALATILVAGVVAMADGRFRTPSVVVGLTLVLVALLLWDMSRRDAGTVTDRRSP